MVLMRGNKVKEKVTPYIDYNLIFIVMFLLAFGLIMLYSVSSYDANITFGDSAYYFKKRSAERAKDGESSQNKGCSIAFYLFLAFILVGLVVAYIFYRWH